MKRILRAAMAEGCRISFLLKFAEHWARARLIILCYHRVLPAAGRNDYILPDLVVTPESFRRQCRILRHYYDVLPLHQAVENIQVTQGRTRPIASITFDDGYQDNYRYAAPILAEAGLKATFFVISDLAGSERSPWYDCVGRAIVSLERQKRRADLVRIMRPFDGCGDFALPDQSPLSLRPVLNQIKRLPSDDRGRLIEALTAVAGEDSAIPPDEKIMTWNQLTDLARQGHEIGSHGCTHEILPQLDDTGLQRETADSRRRLESGVGKPVQSFCYPNGDVDDRVVQMVRSAGYTCAVTVQPGNNVPQQNPYLLNRRFIHEGRLSGPYETASALLLRMELCGLADYMFGRKCLAARCL